jgi:hypothetical protein
MGAPLFSNVIVPAGAERLPGAVTIAIKVTTWFVADADGAIDNEVTLGTVVRISLA